MKLEFNKASEAYMQCKHNDGRNLRRDKHSNDDSSVNTSKEDSEQDIV